MISPRDKHQTENTEATLFTRENSGDDQERRIIIPGEPLTREPARERESPPAPPRSPQPPRGARLRIILLVLIGMAVVFAVGTLWGKALASGTRRMWQAMVGAEDDDATAQADLPGDTPNQFWTCGMHPWVILPQPGLCPICHMELTPLDPAKLTEEIAIDPVVVQNIGVRVAPVKTGPLQKEIRTVGTVAYDEASVRDVNTKIPGWIEELYVDETGAVVQQGEPLFELYSPELYQAQEEYLLTLKGRSSLTRRLLDDVRTKLEFFDIGPEQIRELEQRGTANKTLTITSPHTGVVIDKNAHEGMKIQPGTRVYRIADLSRVWVIATFYEYQLPYIKLGQPAVMTLPYLPGEVFEGEVVYIYPFLQEQSRQVKVRLEFQNPEGRLKPGMFANVELESTLDQQAVLAPREAVISTGTREVAFVSLGQGKFEPREVDTGVETENGLVEILDGLKPGETVVTSGQFLLDSESKMRAALAKMVRGELASEQTPVSGGVAEATVLAELPPAAAERLNGILASSIAIGDALASNSTDAIESPARRIQSGLDALAEIRIPGKPDFWKKSAEAAAARSKAAQLAEVEELDAARRIYASFSQALTGLLEETGVPLSYGGRIEVLTCPMYPPKQGGAVWLQPAGPARNPYMGQGPMLRCVGEREMLPVAGGGSEEVEAEAASAQVDALVQPYLKLRQWLAADTYEGVPEQWAEMREAAQPLIESGRAQVEAQARAIAERAAAAPDNLQEARQALQGISAALIELVRVTPPSDAVAETLYVAYCPMAEASWLQATQELANPYMGQKMLTCGEVQETIPTVST